MGIASHRAAHRRRNENCIITYSGGTWQHEFAEKKESAMNRIELVIKRHEEKDDPQ